MRVPTIISSFALLGFLAFGLAPPQTQAIVAGEMPALHGDANCDKDIDSIDALLVLQLDAGLTSSTPCSPDANQDGAVNSIDAALILQYDACLLIEPWFCE